MKVMVIVKASKDSEAGKLPSQQLLAAMGKFNEELVRAGVMLDGEGLQPSSKGVRVAFHGKERSVINGPFAETKELVAGFWVWKVKSMAEAIEWLKRCPNPHDEPCEVEIRPFFSPEDFAPVLTPEILEHEANVRALAMGLGEVRYEAAGDLLVAGFNSTYDHESRKNIPVQWTRFAPHLGKVPGQVGNTSYGVCWNYKGDCDFDYLCGVEVAESAKLPPDFVRVAVPARRYAIVTHVGHISTFPKTMDKVWAQWIPESGLKTAKAPCFERYTDKFDPKTGEGAVEIWIPLA